MFTRKSLVFYKPKSDSVAFKINDFFLLLNHSSANILTDLLRILLFINFIVVRPCPESRVSFWVSESFPSNFLSRLVVSSFLGKKYESFGAIICRSMKLFVCEDPSPFFTWVLLNCT